jgi:1-acyl-sn-glycerol-3-phosphate acyltransferase
VTAALPEDRTAPAPLLIPDVAPVRGTARVLQVAPSPHEGRGVADLPPGASARLHDVARWVGTWSFRSVLRVHVHHADRIPAVGPVVLVANHSALVDGPLLFGLLGRRAVFLAKREMFRGPLAWLLPLLGQLAVRRGVPDPGPLRAAVAVLRGGGLVGVFPEGTRGTGDVSTAQHGAAWLARATDAVVVPVVARGTRRVPGTRRRFRPRVDVLVGTPLAVPPGGGRTGLTAATETVRAALAGLVVELDEVRSNTRDQH